MGEQPFHILLVEDEEAHAELVSRAFESHARKFRLTVASSLQEARDHLTESTPHLLIADLLLPDGKGTELLPVEEEEPRFPMVVMTCHGDEQVAVEAMKAGALDYVVKSEATLADMPHIAESTLRAWDHIIERKVTQKALVESEARFRAIFETAEDSIFIKDHRLRYVLVNPSMERLYEASASELIGRTDEDLFGEEHGAHTREVDSRVLAGETVLEVETVPVGGVATTFHVIKVPMRAASGGIMGLCGIARDITDRQRLETQLRQAQKMEAVGTLAGGIAHDFNNLLQGIQGYAELLLQGKDKDEPDYWKVKEVVRAAKKGAELTRQLLTFSRKVRSNLRPVDLNVEVKNTKKLLERTIPRMSEIELLLAEDLKFVNADPAQIEQVLVKLAVNAKDALPEEGKLTIQTANVVLEEEYCRTQVDAKPGKYVLLAVSDTGRGMSKDILEHIFEPFYTSKGLAEGSGLGLAMVYGIVKTHGGYITCSSEPGVGSTFEIYLPAIEQEAEPGALKEKGIPIRGGTETILLVDDDDLILDLGKEILTEFGYSVLTAADGESAVKHYRKEQEQIDLVILDLIMPGMSGSRCLEEVLAMNPQAKVVTVSGFPYIESMNRIIEARPKDHIGKPYEMKHLLQVVRRVLDEG